MGVVRGIVGRVRGDHLAAVSLEVAELRRAVEMLHGRIEAVALSTERSAADIATLVAEFNERSASWVPTFESYLAQARAETDAASRAATVIAAQLRALDDRLGTR